MKISREKKSKRISMSDEAFAELEQSLKEALAYEKGEIPGLRVTKKAISLAPKQKSKTAIIDLHSELG